MSAPLSLVVRSAEHPNLRVRDVGFGLRHTYVERCWAPVVGPTSVLLLRRMPELWAAGDPAAVDLRELADSLGLTGYTGGARHSMWRTIERLVTYRVAEWAGDGELAVYRQVAPLSTPQVAALSKSTWAAHHRLIAEHVRELAATGRLTGPGAFHERSPARPVGPPSLGR